MARYDERFVHRNKDKCKMHYLVGECTFTNYRHNHTGTTSEAVAASFGMLKKRYMRSHQTNKWGRGARNERTHDGVGSRA
jgi:hypothetical protein